MRVKSWVGYLALFIALGIPTNIYSAAKVTGITCTQGGNECDTIAHAECDSATTNCKCSTGFEENSNDDTTCIAIAIPPQGGANQPGSKAKVSETTCNQGDECNSIANAACDTATKKCKCSTGFEEDSTDGSTCTAVTNVQGSNPKVTKPRVSGVTCAKGGSECSSITNSGCDETSLKCKCIANFAEDTTDGSKCVQTVSSTTCTAKGNECGAIAHAECKTDKCQCSAGFKMNANTCAADNSGGALTLTFATFTIPVVLALKKTIE